MQKHRNLFNQNFKAELAWSISFGHRESRPGAFPDFNNWRALANCSGEKSPEIDLSGGVGILQSWDTSPMTSLADLRFVVLYTSFLTNCAAIDLAVTGQRRRASLVLPVKFYTKNIFYASRLEYITLMLLTASDQQSFRFSSRWDSKSEAAELLASP